MLNLQTRKQLNELNLPMFIETLDNSYDSYLKQQLDFTDILALLTDSELQYRHQRKIERLLKNARFRYPSARIEDLEYKPQRKLPKDMIKHLCNGSWLDKKQNLLIFGATGTGKTWLSCALGVQACRMGYDTYFITAQQLLEQLSDALLDGSLNQLRKRLIKFKLLIVDDFALGNIDKQLAPLLLELIDQQSINGSLMITSQFPIELWHEKFEDSTIADAILDRIINQAHKIQIAGDSMRKMAEILE